MKTSWGLAGLLLANWVTASLAQEIGSWNGNGHLVWYNDLTNGVYQVEWSSSLTAGQWTNSWSALKNIASTNPQIEAAVPMFYRVRGADYPELTDLQACYARYSNALIDAAVALPEEISRELRPVSQDTPGTTWRCFTNWVDGTTSLWVKVAALKFAGGWTWNSLLSTGEHTQAASASNTLELWVSMYPDLRSVGAAYRGTNRTLRLQKALGLPPRSGNYGVAEIFIDPKYLFRPAPAPGVDAPAAGLAPDTSAPYIQPNPLHGVTAGYMLWFRDTYNSRGYYATNSLDNSWPWTRLGYTYDWENSPNSPYGPSEYVMPDVSQTQYWGSGLTIPYYVAERYPADIYGH